MSAPLPPVRGWQRKLPHRGIRCLLGRHELHEIIFRNGASFWCVHIEECKRCKRPIEVRAKDRKARWR